MKKHLISAVCIALACAALTACSSTDSGTTASTGTAVAATVLSAASTTSADTAVSAADTTSADTAVFAASTTSADTAVSVANITPADTTVSAANTTSAVTTASAAQDTEGAKAAVEAVIKACNAKDKDAFFRYTNMKLLTDGERVDAQPEIEKGSVSAEDVEAEIEDEIQMTLKKYAFGTNYSVGGCIAASNSFIQAYTADLAASTVYVKEREKENPLLVPFYEQILQPVSAIYAVPVTHDGETTRFYLQKSGSDWYVDILMNEFIGDSQKSKVVASNVAARTVYNALSCALLDMEAAELDITGLKGIHTFKGDDFANLSKNSTKPEDILKYKTQSYYTDITQLAEICVKMDEKGCCTAVAVKKKNNTVASFDSDETVQVFGAYPIQIPFDTAEEYKSTEEILKNMKLS